jgi:hypothetical protein
VLTVVKAYSALPSAPTLYLPEVGGGAETDLVQIRNIEGLDPVQAAIGLTPQGSSDGEAFVGANIGTRNIVLTVRPNPDWNTWSPEALRRLLYAYFMPKQKVGLRFLSDDMPDLYIDGYVESFAANMFSKDPEYLASIICENPYFKTTDRVVLTGSANDADLDIEYSGNIPGGIKVTVTHITGTPPPKLTINVGDTAFTVKLSPVVNDTQYFVMSSESLNKYAEIVDTDNSDKVISVLSSITIEQGSVWPILEQGTNVFSVETTGGGVQHWELEYHELFGGL